MTIYSSFFLNFSYCNSTKENSEKSLYSIIHSWCKYPITFKNALKYKYLSHCWKYFHLRGISLSTQMEMGMNKYKILSICVYIYMQNTLFTWNWNLKKIAKVASSATNKNILTTFSMSYNKN